MNIFLAIEAFLASNVGQELTHDLITAVLSEISKLMDQHADEAINTSQRKAVMERAKLTP